MEEKIKEIAEKYEHIDTGMVSIYYVEQALKEYGEWVRQQTLEEVKGCVPSNNPQYQGNGITTDMLLPPEYEQGWKNCRQQTLENIEKLKNKNLLDKLLE